MSRLVVSHLSFGYRRRLVLSDLSLDMESGQLVAVVGPNGAGKSTLLRLLSGWLVPVSGQVLLDGQEVRDLAPAERARKVTLVPQMTEAAHDMPVEELVALGRLTRLSLGQRLLLRPLSDADQAAIESALMAADVKELAKRPFRELSGGERSRARLAVALAQEASWLLLDEPEAHLDPGHAQAVMVCLAAQARAGHGVVAAMHDLTLAAAFADRMALVDQGGLVAWGTPAEVLTSSLVRQVYGGQLRVIPHPEGGSPVVLPTAQPSGGKGA